MGIYDRIRAEEEFNRKWGRPGAVESNRAIREAELTRRLQAQRSQERAGQQRLGLRTPRGQGVDLSFQRSVEGNTNRPLGMRGSRYLYNLEGRNVTQPVEPNVTRRGPQPQVDPRGQPFQRTLDLNPIPDQRTVTGGSEGRQWNPQTRQWEAAPVRGPGVPQVPRSNTPPPVEPGGPLGLGRNAEQVLQQAAAQQSSNTSAQAAADASTRPRPGQAQVLDVTDPMRPPPPPSRVNSSMNPFEGLTNDPNAVRDLGKLRELLIAENFGVDANGRNVGLSREAQRLADRIGKLYGIKDPLNAVRNVQNVTTVDTARGRNVPEDIGAGERTARAGRAVDASAIPKGTPAERGVMGQEPGRPIELTPRGEEFTGLRKTLDPNVVSEFDAAVERAGPRAAELKQQSLEFEGQGSRATDNARRILGLKAGQNPWEVAPEVLEQLDPATKARYDLEANKFAKSRSGLRKLMLDTAFPDTAATTTGEKAAQGAREVRNAAGEVIGRTNQAIEEGAGKLKQAFEAAGRGFTGEVAASAGGRLPPLQNIEADIAELKGSKSGSPTARQEIVNRLEAAAEWAKNLPSDAAPHLQELKQQIINQYENLKGKVTNTFDKISVDKLAGEVERLQTEWKDKLGGRFSQSDIGRPQLEALKQSVDQIRARAGELGDKTAKDFEKFAKKVDAVYESKFGKPEAKTTAEGAGAEPPPQKPKSLLKGNVGNIKTGVRVAGHPLTIVASLGAQYGLGVADKIQAMRAENANLPPDQQWSDEEIVAAAYGQQTDAVGQGFVDFGENFMDDTRQHVAKAGLDYENPFARAYGGLAASGENIAQGVAAVPGLLADLGDYAEGTIDYVKRKLMSLDPDNPDPITYAEALSNARGGFLSDSARDLSHWATQALESEGPGAINEPAAQQPPAAAQQQGTREPPPPGAEAGVDTSEALIPTREQAFDEGVREVGRYGLRNQPIYGYETNTDLDRQRYGDAIFSDTPQGAHPDEFSNVNSPFRGGLGGRGYDRKAEAALVAQRRADTQAQLDINQERINDQAYTRERQKLLKRISRGGKGRTAEERAASLRAATDALSSLESTQQQKIASKAAVEAANSRAAVSLMEKRYKLDKEARSEYKSSLENLFGGKEGAASATLASAISGDNIDQAAVDQFMRTNVAEALKTSGLLSLIPADEIPSPEDPNFWNDLISDPRFFLEDELQVGKGSGWIESDAGKKQIVATLTDKNVDPSLAERYWAYIFQALAEPEE